MNAESIIQDLVIVVADGNMKATIESLLTRHQSLGLNRVNHTIYKDPLHDCGHESVANLLRPLINQYEYCMVVFDHHGCGREDCLPEQIELDVEKDLFRNGWAEKASVIVIEPELEAWVWCKSPHVEGALGWRDIEKKLDAWLMDMGFLAPGEEKPGRPKEAMEAALKKTKKPRSSSIYRELATKVSLTGCRDRAFIKFSQRLEHG